MQHLLDKGIPCAFYQFRCIHKKHIGFRYKKRIFGNQSIGKEVLSLPMHTELDDEQIKFITDSVFKIIVRRSIASFMYIKCSFWH
jgi:dTDP-4-amino-4,6-dideoxygalactose transaminase